MAISISSLSILECLCVKKGDYLQGVIEAGVMRTLMKVLFKTSTHHTSQILRLKAACDLLCTLLGGMALADPLATNVCTSLLPKLLANDDESIRNIACKCLRAILQGLSSGDVTKVVRSEILRPSLKMAKKGNEDAAGTQGFIRRPVLLLTSLDAHLRQNRFIYSSEQRLTYASSYCPQNKPSPVLWPASHPDHP